MDALNPNHAESEFDDLLDRLTNQLALTPVTPPEVVEDQQLEAVPEPRLRPNSVRDVVSTAEGARGIDPIVKIVGILTGSLTVVAVAALIVFGGGEPSTVAAAGVVEDRGAADELAVAAAEQREAAERAHADARNFARLAEHEHELRHEAQRLHREQAALAAEQAAKTKKSKRKRRRRSATKRSSTASDFDML